MFIIPVIIYLVLCIVVGLRTRHQRIGFFGGVILSVFLTPVVVFVAAVLLTPREPRWVR